jgi:hypothetical protein
VLDATFVWINPRSLAMSNGASPFLDRDVTDGMSLLVFILGVMFALYLFRDKEETNE